MKQERVLEIFFRGLRGEDISAKALASEYDVSTKSISRDINDLKNFLAEHRDLVGNTELEYYHQDKCYRLFMDEFLTNKELFSLIEVLIGARAFSKMELLSLVEKMKKFTTPGDRPKLNELIRKELYHYPEVKHDCESVQAILWQLVNCISDKREISIEYYRTDRKNVSHRLRPASVMFTDYYFYLIAFDVMDEERTPLYFRVDRIKHITEHRKRFTDEEAPGFDEGYFVREVYSCGQASYVAFDLNTPGLQYKQFWTSYLLRKSLSELMASTFLRRKSTVMVSRCGCSVRADVSRSFHQVISLRK